MNRLIGDLLDVAVIQSGRLSVRRAPQPPDALVREIVEAFQPAAREKGLALDAEAPEGIPPVLADRDRVLQVLSNLVANALNATERGGVHLAVAHRGPDAVFTVSDTGRGIPADVRPRLFDPYVRASDAPYQGTGLGLSIAKGIVEAHGGTIGLESTPGRGSAFHFTIPLA